MSKRNIIISILITTLSIFPINAFANSKFKETIPISISIRSNWDYQLGNIRNVGSYSLTVSGNAKLIEEDGEFLRYAPENLTVNYKLEDRGIMMNPDDECYGKVIESVKTSGNTSVNEDRFLLDIFLGELGKFSAMQWRGQIPNPENLKKAPASDNYKVMLVVPVKVTYKSLPAERSCEPTWVKSGEAGFGFTIAFQELKPWGMSGNYKWQGWPAPHAYGVSVTGLGAYAENHAHYQVSWTFGEVKPVVRIYYKDKDITDSDSTDIIVGEKVKLKAKIFPEGYGQPHGKWEIGGKIVSGWEAGKNHATVIPFEDYDKPEIEFFWVDGKFMGEPLKVSYSGEVNGKQIEAKTTINVFKPKAKTEVNSANDIQIALIAETEGGEATCEILPGPPGISLNSEIEMPPPFSGHPYMLEYIQLIKGKNWGLEKIGYPKYEWLKDIDKKFCLDGQYPYTYGNSMEDHPGAPLSNLASIYAQMEFQTYLMLIPSDNPQDKNCIWIPLKKVEWKWKASAKVEGDPYERTQIPCGQKFKIMLKLPPGKFKPKAVNWGEHPTWNCCKEGWDWQYTRNITENPNEEPKNWKK